MKNIFTLIILVFLTYSASSQCEPDTTCIDIGEPGQMCPDEMPDGRVNESYFQTITIIAPPTIDYEGNPINLSHLKLVDIANVPQGLTWQSNAVDNLFAIGTSYCVLIEGIPEVAGNYPLGITVKPYIFGIPVPTEVVDDTSLFILIEPALELYEINENGFSVQQPFPNPFENSSEIKINSDRDGIVNLMVFDNLGRTVFLHETQISTGSNSLIIDGESIEKGLYNYVIRFREKTLTGKIVKL